MREELESRVSPATLVFPATNQAARDYFEAARRRGERCLAASSLRDSQTPFVLGSVAHLPYIYDPSFPSRFLDFVETHNVGRVYSPVASVHVWLAAFIAERNLKLELVGDSPIRQQVANYQGLRAEAARSRAFVEQCAGGASSLTTLDIAAILRQAGNIYGESSEEKIAAMMAVFADAPKGDVVEIGVLMGRTAFVLAYLARHYGTGAVLAVDPWSAVSAVQDDSPDLIRSTLVAEWDCELLHEAFVINLLPFAGTSFNYLRLESEPAFDFYRGHQRVISSHFGDVSYAGEISVLHVDGNHDYRHVSQDCELWLSRLAAGGWLILDDYLWVHGDGPFRVGNALLEERSNDIERAFVCGKALFVRFK